MSRPRTLQWPAASSPSVAVGKTHRQTRLSWSAIHQTEAHVAARPDVRSDYRWEAAWTFDLGGGQGFLFEEKRPREVRETHRRRVYRMIFENCAAQPCESGMPSHPKERGVVGTVSRQGPVDFRFLQDPPTAATIWGPSEGPTDIIQQALHYVHYCRCWRGLQSAAADLRQDGS